MDIELEHHPLVHEFAEYRDRIHELKIGDPEFHDLMARYDAIDKEIYRIEQGIETTSDAYLEVLKKKRLYLRDKLFKMISEEPA